MQIIGSTTEKRLFWREFWILFGAGLIANAILVALSHLPTTPVAMFWFIKDNPQSRMFLAIAAAEIVIDLALVVGLGLLAAHAMGFGAPILETWLRGEPVRPQLRSVCVPALLVGISIGLWAVVPDLPVLHPNRQSLQRESEKIINSAAGAKLTEFVKRTSGAPLTSAELALSDVCGAISGELTARLLFLSGIAWILAKATRTAPNVGSQTFLWISVLLATAVGVILQLAWQSVFERLMHDALGGISLPSAPVWLITTRLLLGMVPAGVGLGWLYVRRGLESAIIASIISSAAGYAATTFLLARLY
jgi:hypothetical protein